MKTYVLPNQIPLPFSMTESTLAPEPPIEVPNYAMWVGGQFYPTPQAYIDEAEALGCSKRLPGIPENLVIGQSKVYLAHGQQADRIAQDPILANLEPSWRSRALALARKVHAGAITHTDAISKLPKKLDKPCTVLDAALTFVTNEDNVIFGYFIVTRLEFIVPQDGSIPDKVKALIEQDRVKLVSWTKAQDEPDRGCGRRKAGGLYAVAYADDVDVAALRKDTKVGNIHGALAVLHRPFKAPFGFFRGIKRLDGDALNHIGVVAALIGTKGVQP